MKAVIMAGGKGTRISSINSSIPKPMIRILNKPILEYQIEILRKNRITDIIIVVGHLGNVIMEYFNNGNNYGVNIEYIIENEPLGTAGALFYLKDKIRDDFLLINGDIIFDMDLNRFYTYHKRNNNLATIVTHPNSHPYDSAVIVAKDNKVIKWLSKTDERKWYKNRVNAGIHLLSHKLLDRFIKVKNSDLDKDVLKPLIEEKQLFIYESSEYIKDMGTPNRLKEVENDIISRKVYKKNILQKQKAIFLDRDGTINKYVGFLNNIDEFELITNVPEAIKQINDSEYLAIVITNQPVIARGDLSFEELEEIHNKMETKLGEYGAYLDGIYLCPHHPDRGFYGELLEYKIKCNCRKPLTGLVEKAIKDFNIDVENSWFIGDSAIDIECGKNINCKTGLIINDRINNKFSCQPSLVGKSLLDIVNLILMEEKNDGKI